MLVHPPALPVQIRITVADDARGGAVEEVDDLEAVLGDGLAGLGAFDEEVGVFGDEAFGCPRDRDDLVAPEVAAAGVVVGGGGELGGDAEEGLALGAPELDGLVDGRGREVFADDGGEVVLAALEVEQLGGRAGGEGVAVLQQAVAAGDREVELAGGDELRHVVRADDLHVEAFDAGRRAPDGLAVAVAVEGETGVAQRFDDVALLVAVGNGEAEGVALGVARR